MDSIEAKLHSTKWTYADHDDRAMHEISRRVAQVGKAGKLTTYTELIQGLIFHLPTVEDGRPFQIDTLEWSIRDRAIVGSFLGKLCSETYRRGRFMGSALVVGKAAATYRRLLGAHGGARVDR